MEEVVDEVLRERRRAATQRQRLSCQRRQEVAEAIAREAELDFGDGDEEHVDMRLVCSIADRLEIILLHELQVCRGKKSKDTVMEVFLRAPVVCPHMPVITFIHRS
jgi:hypothetical protein